ncbi:DUF58 domain-containing protein [Nitrosophilus alvini]|uniref:DUF58 domain-containing protein n=1 Tax=Nitrosophilus alvini TaxID=2714855 RepID=UPI001F39FCAB|nr:DUF58 domain-containing protein [Nitrosophilus alvini]
MDLKAKKIIIKARRQIFGEISGNNLSMFKGEGFDFAELREYEAGEDIKKIDWMITAKLQKPYVKIYHEERELNVVSATMLDGNTYFGSRRFKYETIAHIVALLGFSAVKNSDRFSSYIFADRLYSKVSPSKTVFGVKKSVEEITLFNPLKKRADYHILAKTLFRQIKRRSLIFIIGDFLEEFDLTLLSKKHEVVCIVVRDRLEEDPPDMGMINLYDPNSGKSALFDIDAKSIKRYKKEIVKKDAFLYKHLRKNRIRFVKIYTDEEPFVKLARLFGKV